MDDEIAITELTKIEADRVDGVGTPANGIPFIIMKSLPEPVEKDWADWDAAHEGGKGGSNAGGASAVAEARQTLAEEKAKGKNGKKPTAAELHNAHEVHVAHEEHLAHLHGEHVAHEAHVGHTEHETHEEHLAAVRAERGQTHPASSGKTSTAKPVSVGEAKAAALSRKSAGGRDCPECGKDHDADHKGNTCEGCGAKLPAAAAKSVPDWHAEAAALVKKAMARGKVDETPDIDGGQEAIALLGKLIGYEAQELAAGNVGEVADIEMLADAASLLRMWVSGEQAVAAGNVMPATALMQSAAEVEKGGPSAEERRQAAKDGNALPDGSYPIRNTKELHSAAVLARSGHGDAAAAKRLIARRARELGVANPLDSDDASKSVSGEQEGAGVVNTEAQESEAFAKALADAVTKATAPLEERLKVLDAELAKVKATPIPGGPMMSAVRQAGKAADSDKAAKAAYYRAQADAISDRDTAAGYRQRARELDEEAAVTQ